MEIFKRLRDLLNPPWLPIGNVTRVTREQQCLQIQCEKGLIVLCWITPEILHVHAQKNAIAPTASATRLIAQPDSLAITWEWSENADSIESRTINSIARITKHPYRLSLETIDGHVIVSDAASILWRGDHQSRLSLVSESGEVVFGLGEFNPHETIQGKLLTFPSIRSTGSSLYIVLKPSDAYAVLWDSPSAYQIDAGKTQPEETRFEAAGDEVNYYLLTGVDDKQIVSRYSELVGRATLPPLWSLAYQQWSPDLQPESLAPITEGFLSNAIPMRVIRVDSKNEITRTSSVAPDYQVVSVRQTATSPAFTQASSDLRPYSPILRPKGSSHRDTISDLPVTVSHWDDMPSMIHAAVNAGLSGAGFGSTSGCRAKDPELYTRWLQAASMMSSLYAVQMPWSIGQPHSLINRIILDLRHQFTPYLYSVIAQSCQYGWPYIRPTLPQQIEQPSYRIGDALLVAPVLTANTVEREVRLPSGLWYDYWTNDLYDGDQTIQVPAPLERIPLFVRAGAIIPMYPSIQDEHTDHQSEKETLIYRVYPGNLETVLYEDAGEGLDYQQGDYRWVYLNCSVEDGLVLINRRIAGRYQPNYQRILVEVVHFDQEPLSIRADRYGAPIWFYNSGIIEMSLDNFQQIEITPKLSAKDRTIKRKSSAK